MNNSRAEIMIYDDQYLMRAKRDSTNEEPRSAAEAGTEYTAWPEISDGAGAGDGPEPS